MCPTGSREKEYIHPLTSYKERYLVIWKFIGVAIVLIIGVLVNTPAIAVDQTPTMARSSGACLSPPTVQLKMSATAIPASDSLKTLVKMLCSKGIELDRSQLDEVLEKSSLEVSRKSSLSSIFPPKKSLTTVTIFYNGGNWGSKSITTVSAEKDLLGIMILMVIATFISGTLGKSLVWRPASLGIIGGAIVIPIIGSVVINPLTGVIAGGLVGILVAIEIIMSPLVVVLSGGFISLFTGAITGGAVRGMVTSVLLEWATFCISLIALEFTVYFVHTFIRRKFNEYKNEQGESVSK